MLSGGGARAAYQVGVLSAIAERVPDLHVPILSGVSAGAINTVTLAAHPGLFAARLRALRHEWAHLTVDHVYRVRVGGLARSAGRWILQRFRSRRKAPTVVRGVMDMDPLREFLSARVSLAGIQANVAGGRLSAVTLGATCYDTGDTVTFVQGGTDLPMWTRAQRRSVQTELSWDHVMASSAIPILFPAVRIGGLYYGDGSVRQGAPLAPPIHLGARKILAVAMRPHDLRYDQVTAHPEYPSAAQVMGMLFHSIFLDSLETDAERLERLNHLVRRLAPEERAAVGLDYIKLLVLRPSVDLGALARPHFSRLPPLMRRIVDSMGGQKRGSADFLSYLLFDPAYVGPLIELGYDDAMEQWDRIEQFLADGE